MDFTHLHVHSEYSLLDGLNRIEDLFKKSKEYGMSSIALTDHGVLYGAAEFWKTAHDFGIKPIIGCEMYITPGNRKDRAIYDGINYYHLLLLAKNLTGYKNLVKLVTIGQLEGMYYRPRIDKESLKKYSEGLICTSACLAGPLARHIVRDEEEKAEEWLRFLQNIFKDDFYLELQRNGFKNKDALTDEIVEKYDPETLRMLEMQFKVNNKLRDFSAKYKIPLIATTDAHYLNREDQEVQTIMFCIKDGNKLQDSSIRTGYLGTYIKSPEEMYAHFEDDTSPLLNTMQISEKVEDYKLKFERVQPRYLDLPKGKTAKEELREQAFIGAEKKYKKLSKDLKERIEYELSVIDQRGYNDYFLIVGDLMQFARSKEIIVGVRGSAAGSVVAYSLDITNVDPIKWELYFERFLSLERPSPPDIDMDFQDNRRDEIIEYAKKKYGEMNVAAICAMGSMQTKAAIRDVARVMGIDLQIADKLSKKVQVVFGKVFPIDKMIEIDAEFKEIIESSPELQKLAAYVRKVEGLARHISTHAAGYLITPEPINEYMALQRDSKDPDKIMTQVDGTWIDKLDFMKFDFLGLRTLTILKNTLDLIQKKFNKKIDLAKIPENDKKAFELFGRGETVGVFQFESPPMQQYLRDLKPHDLEDICFLAAAYRPGPMKYIPDYILCKHGKKEPRYLIPELEPILKKTYGFPIYQEQLLRICLDLGGFTMGDGDVIRNALKKKQLDILQEKEPFFKENLMKRFGYDDDTAQQVWNQLTPFADYGFNKAHSASYAVVAYWCAYLKAHYPLEFMAALMMSDLESMDRIVVDIKEAKRMGYAILPPDVNASEVAFTSENDKAIRFGIGAIKNVGHKVAEAIVEEREANGKYKSLDDLVSRIGTGRINKKSVECLIKVGAMNSFGEQNALLAVVEQVFSKVTKNQIAEKAGQASLFSMDNSSKVAEANITPLPEVTSANEHEKLNWEKELMGIYLSSNPLDEFANYYQDREILSLRIAKDLQEGEKVKVLSIISSVKYTHTKKDGKKMAMLQIEDFDSRAEAVVFPRAFTKLENMIQENRTVIMSGTVNIRNESLNLLIEDIFHAKEYNLQLREEILIDICNEKDEEKLKLIKQTIISNPGRSVLRIIYGTSQIQKEIIRKINPTKDVLEILKPYLVAA